MKENKYNYVFYNSIYDYNECIFGALKKYEYIKIFKHAFKSNSFIEKIFFLHWSRKINNIIKLPFKKIWYKKMCCHKFKEKKPCCFVFLEGKYITEDEGLFKFIKELNPDNKCVMLCFDLLTKRNFDVKKNKKFLDKIITYDFEESKLFNIDYLNMDYYVPISDVTEPQNFDNDVYFLGFAKDRLDYIHNAYKFFINNKLKCKFVICGVPKKYRLKGEGLYYSKPISYKENLENISNSKCILEIIQGKSVAPTLRLREAFAYKRKLITNNTNTEYYNYLTDDNLLVLSDENRMDINFVNSAINYDSFSDEYSTPITLIEYLEKNL